MGTQYETQYKGGETPDHISSHLPLTKEDQRPSIRRWAPIQRHDIHESSTELSPTLFSLITQQHHTPTYNYFWTLNLFLTHLKTI